MVGIGTLFGRFWTELVAFGTLLGGTWSRFEAIKVGVYAYLGLTDSGAFQLYVSTSVLNPVGTRLERGQHRRLPESIRAQVQDPNNPQAALAGLISLHKFLRGEEQGPGALEFGVDHLPLIRKKK